ncbi:hypothetical protein A3Q56_01022 [Intoshia linei]|uniref:Uncharacterized protein n=1 Tax=Intoshia linei TaxID=1819745 RepID=A0A177BAG4_9BILA|nr:hypothetical protein A3Q56_01022 [Intoshia linei]
MNKNSNKGYQKASDTGFSELTTNYYFDSNSTLADRMSCCIRNLEKILIFRKFKSKYGQRMVRKDDTFIRINLIQQVTGISQQKSDQSKSVEENQNTRKYSSIDCIKSNIPYASKLNINNNTLKSFDDSMSYNYMTIKAHPSSGENCQLYKVAVLGADNLDKRTIVENMMNYTFIEHSHSFENDKRDEIIVGVIIDEQINIILFCFYEINQIFSELIQKGFNSIIIVVKLSCYDSFLFVKRLFYRLSALYKAFVPKIIVGREANEYSLKSITNELNQWFQRQRTLNISISGNILKEVVPEIGNLLNLNDFKASTAGMGICDLRKILQKSENFN